jgi:flagellar motility protein MotE (MotC chaperone)
MKPTLQKKYDLIYNEIKRLDSEIQYVSVFFIKTIQANISLAEKKEQINSFAALLEKYHQTILFLLENLSKIFSKVRDDLLGDANVVSTEEQIKLNFSEKKANEELLNDIAVLTEFLFSLEDKIFSLKEKVERYTISIKNKQEKETDSEAWTLHKDTPVNIADECKSLTQEVSFFDQFDQFEKNCEKIIDEAFELQQIINFLWASIVDNDEAWFDELNTQKEKASEQITQFLSKIQALFKKSYNLLTETTLLSAQSNNITSAINLDSKPCDEYSEYLISLNSYTKNLHQVSNSIEKKLIPHLELVTKKAEELLKEINGSCGFTQQNTHNVGEKAEGKKVQKPISISEFPGTFYHNRQTGFTAEPSTPINNLLPSSTSLTQ